MAVRRSRIQKVLFVLALVLVGLLVASNPALAADEAPNPEDSVEAGAVGADGAADADEDLLAAYLEQRFAEQLSDNPLRARRVPSSLTGNDALAYQALAAAITEVAAGTRASTIIELPLEVMEGQKAWTAEELGLETIEQDGKATQEAMDAAGARFPLDMNTIHRELLSAYPCELYWYDKTPETGGMRRVNSFVRETVGNDRVIRISRITLRLCVSKDYRPAGHGDENLCYDVSTPVDQRVTDAISYARSVAASYAGRPTYERLAAYKEEICRLVSYNHKALSSAPYGDPWQLVWVFDGDSSTNVVCEGYAKAFQYLCDLSEFDDVYCYTVTGTIPSGRHMWDIVSMPDGKNYLVDLTNCDEGMTCYPGGLFMRAPMAGGSVTGANFFATNSGGSLRYTYDESARELYTTEELTLDEESYTPPYPVSLEGATVSLVDNTFTYTGDAIEPSLSSVVFGAELVAGEDYTVTYEANTDAGTGRAVVTGIGNYSGSIELPFTIEPKSVTPMLALTPTSLSYTGASQRPNLAVEVDDITLDSSAYRVVWPSASTDTGTYTVSVTLEGNYVGAGSAPFDIAPASLAKAAITVANQVYTGSAIKPAPTVKLGGRTLKQGTNYTVTYAANTNVGTASLTVAGKGNYTGKATATFAIAPASLAKASVSGIADATYTGKAIKPVPTVKLGGKTLKQGTDYTVSYANNTKVGTASVKIAGKGNYTGTLTETFFIKDAPITWKRLAGGSRYGTMSSIVNAGWKGTTGGTVVVATGAGFKDALAAAGLAGLDNAPVVLTDGAALSSAAKTRLVALKPRTIYVAGGPVAVSDEVVAQIKEVTGVAPKRVSGATSSATSAALALAGKGRWADATAVIATNKSYKDALSVAPVAYAKHWPILLSDNGERLSTTVLKALKGCGIKHVYVVGGELAVSPQVVTQLGKAGISVKARLAGSTGTATSRAIATWALKNGLGVRYMAFATSQDFPDALAGAALCGKNKAVLLLADDRAPGNLSFATTNRNDIGTGYVLGGELAFSEALMAKLP